MIRAIEVCLLTGRPLTEVHRAGRARLEGYAPLKIGLQPPRAALYDRIEQRVQTMLDRGWIVEVTGLLRSGIPHNAKPFDFIGYSELRSHLEGTVTLPPPRRRFLRRRAATPSANLRGSARNPSSTGSRIRR